MTDDTSLVHATEVDQFVKVDALLHDLGFSMLDVTYDKSLGVVEIPFRGTFKTHDLLVRKQRSDGAGAGNEEPAEPVLVVRCVEAMTAHDPDGIVQHSYSRLKCPESGQLIVESNFPGGVDLRVSQIDVRVRT